MRFAKVAACHLLKNAPRARQGSKVMFFVSQTVNSPFPPLSMVGVPRFRLAFVNGSGLGPFQCDLRKLQRVTCSKMPLEQGKVPKSCFSSPKLSTHLSLLCLWLECLDLGWLSSMEVVWGHSNAI